MAVSMSAEAVIEKAKLCYSLDLITERQLEAVISRAEREPGYNAILDLPLDHEVKDELQLRRQAARPQRRWWRRAIGAR